MVLAARAQAGAGEWPRPDTGRAAGRAQSPLVRRRRCEVRTARRDRRDYIDWLLRDALGWEGDYLTGELLPEDLAEGVTRDNTTVAPTGVYQPAPASPVGLFGERATSVAAEEAVVAQQPEVAWFGLGLIRQRRQVIGVSKRRWALEAVEELLEVALVESEDVEITLLRP